MKSNTQLVEPSADESGKPPIHEVRLGRIKASIWANDTETGVRYNVKLSRLYKVEDAWEQSNSFGRDDLLLLAKVADRAHTWIFEQSQDSASHGEARR